MDNVSFDQEPYLGLCSTKYTLINGAIHIIDSLDPRIIMFCGKGGVGKTTCSGITAIHYANQGKRTLLISTDPSPSLTDILETDVSKGVTRIDSIPNLSAVELDYEHVVVLWKERYGQEVYEVISSFLPVGEEIIDYISGAPGIDEEFALSYVLDLYEGGDYDVIVWDTAPAGGTLSLLHLQDTFYQHMGEAAKLFLNIKNTLNTIKGKDTKNPLKLIEEWKQLSKDVLDMLRADSTYAFLVTIPEALSVNQTQRIAKELDRFGVQLGGIIINTVLSEQTSIDSEFYRKRREVHLKYIKEIEETYKETLPLMRLPLQSFEVKGIEALKRVESQFFRLSHQSCSS